MLIICSPGNCIKQASDVDAHVGYYNDDRGLMLGQFFDEKPIEL